MFHLTNELNRIFKSNDLEWGTLLANSKLERFDNSLSLWAFYYAKGYGLFVRDSKMVKYACLPYCGSFYQDIRCIEEIFVIEYTTLFQLDVKMSNSYAHCKCFLQFAKWLFSICQYVKHSKDLLRLKIHYLCHLLVFKIESL